MKQGKINMLTSCGIHVARVAGRLFFGERAAQLAPVIMRRGTRTLALALFATIAQVASASSFRLLTAPHPGWEPPTAGSSDSYSPILTPDARYILFTSAAENLCLTTNSVVAVAAFPGRLNVFLRERTNGIISMVSVNTNGTGGGNGDSIGYGISDNGQVALFESSASDLVVNDTNGVQDIFVRDIVEGETVCVSVSTNGGSGNGKSWSPTFTPDGRFAAFVSAATDLVTEDTNGIPDIFVRDLQLNTTVLASSGATATNILSRSESPQISTNGRFVAFHSTATNLVPNVDTAGEIYLRDLVAGTTVIASTNARAVLNDVLQSTNGISYNHVMSADGRFVAFEVSRNAGVYHPGIILRYQRETGLTDIIHTNAFVPNMSRGETRNLSITPDGRFLAFIAAEQGTVGDTTSIQVWDADSGTTTLVSGNTLGQVPTGTTCDWPSIDPTGRYVAFISSATGLVTNSLAAYDHVYLRDRTLNTTTLVNVNTNGSGSAVAPFGIPSLSDDGRYVAFEAQDGFVVAGDNNRAYDVFLRDVVSGTSELVSAHLEYLPSQTSGGVSTLLGSSVSASGRYVAFVSGDANLVLNDTNGVYDVFVRDMVEGTTTLVSINTNGWSANAPSIEPSISSDGRYVAFASTASDLAPRGSVNVFNVFVRDMQSARVDLASAKYVAPPFQSSEGGNSDSSQPQVSADGLVLFRSRASNLTVTNISSGTLNLFLRRIQTSNTVMVTSSGFVDASMTPDGRYLAYCNSGQLWVRDTQTSATAYTTTGTAFAGVSISTQGNTLAFIRSGNLHTLNWRTLFGMQVGPLSTFTRGTPRFSGDERFITFAAGNQLMVLPDTNAAFDVYRFELETGVKTLISRNYDATAAANAGSDYPTISDDGRFIAYRSAASDLVPGVANAGPNIFLYDRDAGPPFLGGTNRLLSFGNNRATAPIFSGDGRFLVFPSWASDLTTNDFNRRIDLFGYAFLYLTITDAIGGPIVSWPAMPLENYQVQYKDSLPGSAWQVLPGVIVFNGNGASIQDTTPANPQRVYRVQAF